MNERGADLGVNPPGPRAAPRARPARSTPAHRSLRAAAFALLPLLGAGCAPGGTSSDARVRGRLDGAACDTVRLGGRSAPVDPSGRFQLRVPMTEPRYDTLECGGSLRLFLSPGDRLQVDLRADASPSFSGRGSEANNFLAEMEALWRRLGPGLENSYPRLVALDEGAFVAAWDSSWNALHRPLEGFLSSATAHDLLAKIERARVLYAWAEGRVRYPYLHWRARGTDSIEVTPRYHDYLERLALNDPELLAVEEFRSFLGAYVHERTRVALQRTPSLRAGDNRWTRAKYSVATSALSNEKVRSHLLHSILLDHLDRYGSKDLDELVERFRRDCPDEALVREVDEAHRKDRSLWDGHEIEVYKTVDGTSLEAHISPPDGHRPGDRRPALVWFHGGSWTEGAWYWCLGLCGRFVSKGMVVVQVEYRVHDRHGSTPLESIADAKSAIRWVRRNAGRLGVDPARVVAAGFSAGGHLAASAAILPGFDEPGEDARSSARPDAVVLFGACVDPTRDPWYVQVVRGRAAPRDGSPAHHVRPGLPPTLVVHGTGDRMCPFSSISRFAEAMKAAGNVCRVESFEGRPHFFLWQNPDDRSDALDRVVGFLTSQGILRP